MKRSILFIFLIFSASLLHAQDEYSIVTGKVIDNTGEELPGVNVVIKGTTEGTVTDISGNYTVRVTKAATLIFSYVGYLSQQIEVGNKSVINVELLPDLLALEEVVVVGYGSQKKSVVTGAISSVKAKDLEGLPIPRIEQSLQGRTSGVVVAANSGQPGSSATVRIRGITSLNDGANDPLWVVDGVVVDNGGIGYLNQSDIESIEVLKDAASQAIYGARAASGVILITTKKGKVGRVSVTYNGFYGTSAPAQKLDLTNAEQYATLENESSVAAGGPVLFPNPGSLGQGTDWQEQIFNDDARRQNHELSISGGNEVSTYFASFGYWDQEGIVATDISNYERFTLRLNSNHKVNKWLTFGQNFGYAREKSIGIGNTNSEFGGPLSSAINLDPITQVIITDPAEANSSPYTNEGIQRDRNGNPYGISTLVGQELSNPLAFIQTKLGNYGWSDNFIGNVYAEIQIMKGLKFRSTLGSKLAWWGDETFNPVYYLNSTTINSTNSFNRSMNRRVDL